MPNYWSQCNGKCPFTMRMAEAEKNCEILLLQEDIVTMLSILAKLRCLLDLKIFQNTDKRIFYFILAGSWFIFIGHILNSIIKIKSNGATPRAADVITITVRHFLQMWRAWSRW